METQKLDRFSSLPLGRGRVAHNRLVVPPMASGTADERGFATDLTVEHYARLARSGAGIIFVEYSYVHPGGRSEEQQLGAWTDAQIPGLSRIAAAIHAEGALAGLQLTHAGGKSSRDMTGGALQAPSDIPVPVKNQEMERPEAMSREQIEIWKESFRLAADRAVAAGFDLVELHSAHGYGLNQWLSPITNRRSDAYGASLAGRLRLLREIVESIRERHPRLLISVRIPGQDFVPEGLSTGEMTEVARILAALGVDILNVSSGIGGWRRPGPRVGEGYLVEESRRIRTAVGIPVIGVGGIQTGAYIDRALREGAFSLAAVGRAILENPEAWRTSQMRRDVVIYEAV